MDEVCTSVPYLPGLYSVLHLRGKYGVLFNNNVGQKKDRNMKMFILIVSLGLGLIIPGLSAEREAYNAGKKQELLSSAAAYALEAGDTHLLDALKNAGWDSSKNLGQMPDQETYIKSTPLTFSTLVGAEGGVRWLLESCGLSRDSRDGNLYRPIDVLLKAQNSGDALSLSKEEGDGLRAL